MSSPSTVYKKTVLIILNDRKEYNKMFTKQENEYFFYHSNTWKHAWIHDYKRVNLS